MSSGQIHFEVFARRNQNATLALEMATEDRARAMAYAEELMQSGSVAVRVSKEVLDIETGEYSSATILAKGVAAPAGPAALRAREALMRMSKVPEIRADLAKSPDLLSKLRPLMTAAAS